MIAWSVAVREALTTRFGPGWRAKTTEEIAADSSLTEALGPILAARVVQFLRAADRAKFADSDEPAVDPDFEGLAALIPATAAAAGASSRIKG